MELRIWQQSKQKQLYTRRRPEETPLYRIVYHYAEQLQYLWDERYLQQYGCLREAVRDAFVRYLDCGVLRHGCARAACPKCDYSRLIAFSCKRRGLCPSCDAKRGYLFAENLTENVLLPYPVRHLVFTIPKRLRIYFRYDRALTKHLYAAAWHAWRQFCRCDESPNQSAMVAALHTAGDLLNFHPHIHAMALSGSIDHQGMFHRLEMEQNTELAAVFADYLFRALLEERLLDEQTVEAMQAWRHSGFNVFVGDEIPPDDTERLLFLARYLKRCPVALNRLSVIEKVSEPLVRVTKSTDEPEIYRDFSPLDFLAELSQHIPDTFEQTVRYYGLFSARTRGKKKLAEKTIPLENIILGINLPEQNSRPISSSWARLIKKVYEVDPLVCPKCGENMKITAFIQDQHEIKRICENLGIQDWRAPPRFETKSEPQIIELFDDLQYQ